jgi:hypothetical protein
MPTQGESKPDSGALQETYLEQARRQACDEIASGPTTRLMTPFVKDLHEIEAKGSKPKTERQKVLASGSFVRIVRFCFL